MTSNIAIVNKLTRRLSPDGFSTLPQSHTSYVANGIAMRNVVRNWTQGLRQLGWERCTCYVSLRHVNRHWRNETIRNTSNRNHGIASPEVCPIATIERSFARVTEHFHLTTNASMALAFWKSYFSARTIKVNINQIIDKNEKRKKKQQSYQRHYWNNL